ncbi:cohesin domain-containing protein [Thalassotalea euphylliae]|uniref:cohesin domain-containing protein n=1 Tax=Thalassotalea euphylliae TaxID=1655234 RepID=UPI0036340051
MKKVVFPLLLMFSLLFANVSKANVILTLDTPAQDAALGDLVAVSLMIDGLGDGVPLSLSSFDVNIAFDSSSLSFAGYNLFGGLGNLDFFEAFDTSFGDLGGGLVNISEISFLSNVDLWSFQPGSFALAELFFTVDAVPSASNVSIDGAVLFDVNGDLINITGVNNTSITAVPNPAMSMLMGLGLLVLLTRKKMGH